MQFKKITLALAAVAAMSAMSARAVNLVVNGGFETTTNGKGQLGFNTNATGWTNVNGYTFLYTPGTVDSSGALGQYGNVSMWGSNNGGVNALPNSPTGGNFVAFDGGFQVAPLQQTIFGLVVGQKYELGFDWGAAQQFTFTGATTDQWRVSLGNETHSTAVVNNASHGFSGWMHQTFTFTATGASEVLSFLAVGTPNGVPPFALLDGVTLAAAVPEPSTWALMLGGFAVVGFIARRRRTDLMA